MVIRRSKLIKLAKKLVKMVGWKIVVVVGKRIAKDELH